MKWQKTKAERKIERCRRGVEERGVEKKSKNGHIAGRKGDTHGVKSQLQGRRHSGGKGHG